MAALAITPVWVGWASAAAAGGGTFSDAAVAEVEFATTPLPPTARDRAEEDAESVRDRTPAPDPAVEADDADDAEVEEEVVEDGTTSLF